MKKLLVAMIALLSLNVSAGALCSIAEKGIAISASTVAKVFKCKNQDNIIEDFKMITKFESMCNADDSLNYSYGLTCKYVSVLAADFVSEKIPNDWECDKFHSSKLIKSAIYKSCIKIFEQD